MLDKTKKVVCELDEGREKVISVASEYEAKKILAWYEDAGLKNEVHIKDISEFIKSETLEAQIEELMSAAGYYDIYPNNGYVAIEIIWGDWKHDHIHVNDLMREAFGLKMEKETITEEDGDDAYSSIHYYKIP